MNEESPNAIKPTPSSATAYYLMPPVYVCGSPWSFDDSVRWVMPKLDLSQCDIKKLADEVYRKDLGCGISVVVLREGLFVFDFSKWGDAKGVPKNGFATTPMYGALERVAVLNTHLACLYTVVQSLQHQSIPKMVLSPGNLFSMSFQPPYLGGSCSNEPQWSPFSLSRFVSTYNPNYPPGLDFRIISRRINLTPSAIEKSFELFEKALGSNTMRIIAVADLYLRSCSVCEEHNFALSTVLAWTACEKLLNVLWERHIDDCDRENSVPDAKFVNRTRKERLMGANFTASVVIEILSLANHIDFALYEKLNKVRRARNNWVHDLESEINSDIAQIGLQATGDLMELVDAIPIRLAPTLMAVPVFAPLNRA